MSQLQRIKAGIAFMTMLGVFLGTAGISSAKTTSPVHPAKVAVVQTVTKSTHHQAKPQFPRRSV